MNVNYHQQATMALAAAQLQIGTAMNVWEVEQGFPLGSTNEAIVDLMESFKSATNTILPKVYVDEILHANLDPWSVTKIERHRTV